MMSGFARPAWLILLFILPLLLAWLARREARDATRRERFADANLFSWLAIGRPLWARRLYRLFLIGGLALLIIAMARPLGRERFETVEADGVDIVFAIDVSESMRAEDMRPGNRLEVTKIVVSRFIQQLAFDRVAIVAFAGNASVQCPLTLAHDTAVSFLQSLDFGTVEKNGTNLAEAILTANDRFIDERNVARVIILLTDGEDQEGAAVEAARRVAAQGTRIYSIGIGDPRGVPIPVGRTVFGEAVYKRYRGQLVKTKLEEKTLRDIAYVSGGKYFHVTSNETLQNVLEEIRAMDRRVTRVSRQSIRSELFQFFLAPALLFLAAAIFLSDRRRIGGGA